ncbi:MAG: G8 domain-containing protein [Pseudomonadota bacterium]
MPPMQMPSMPHTHMPSMALVSLDQVTHTAAQSGDWSDPATWGTGGVPGAGARVHIPAGIEITVDTTLAPEFKTVRIDGTLSFATDVNTELKVDTLVSTQTGRLVMGTQTDPIQAGVTASIEFADDGAIDQTWDPALISRGALLHGQTIIHGAEKTAFIAVDGGFAAGTSAITLATLPTGWAMGDELVIAGTDPLDPTSDETVTIQEITTGPSGVTIVFNRPLERDHLAPRADLDVHIANMTRNVTFTSEDLGALNRGHVMFMHTNDVDARYVSFQGLGRTDKTLGLNDWRLLSNPEESILPDDMIIEDLGGTNVRGRYSVHFHQAGVDGEAALVQGAVVRDDPGWAYVNHSSNVDFIGNVSHNIVGSAYNTEAGDEQGSFVGNIAIRTVSPTARLNPSDITFDPDQAPGQRVTTQDYGWQGDGFWFHGANVHVEDNIVSGATGRGYIYWGLGLVEEDLGEKRVRVSDLPNWEATGLPADAVVRTKHMPVASFDGNTAYSTTKGLNVYYIHTGLRDEQDAFLISEDRLVPVAQAYEDQLQSVFSNYTAWNVPLTAIEVRYSSRLTFENVDITGAGAEASVGISLDNFANMDNFTVRNATIDGFEVGIAAPRQGDSVIDGATISAPTDIRINAPDRQARDLEIKNVTFAPLSDLSPGVTEFDFMRRNIEMDPARDLGFAAGLFEITEALSGEDGLTHIPSIFQPDRITLEMPGAAPVGLFFGAQGPGFVPIPPGSELSRYTPAELVGLTNAELQEQFGFSFSDALLPPGSTTDPRVSGGFVGPALAPFPAYPPAPDPYWVTYLETLGIDLSGLEPNPGTTSESEAEPEPEPRPEPEPELRPVPEPEPESEDPNPPMDRSGRLEIGSIVVSQTNAAQWFEVQFSEPIMDARVVMGPITHNGGQPAVPRVRNVTEDGFEFQIDEWDYLDGAHVSETISWMAMTEGTHVLSSGQIITAGRVVAENGEPVSVALSDFTEVPAVFGQITSANGPEAVTNRIYAVSPTGFTVRLREEEASDQIHDVETIDWVAVDYGIFGDEGTVFELEDVRNAGETFFFEDADDALFASMQTHNGGDTAALRLDNAGVDLARVFVEEEQSRDAEIWHTDEDVAVIVIEPGLYELF